MYQHTISPSLKLAQTHICFCSQIIHVLILKERGKNKTGPNISLYTVINSLITYEEVDEAASHQYDVMQVLREVVEGQQDQNDGGDELEQDTDTGDDLTHDEPGWNKATQNQTTSTV